MEVEAKAAGLGGDIGLYATRWSATGEGLYYRRGVRTCAHTMRGSRTVSWRLRTGPTVPVCGLTPGEP